jgi:hypothetical protein
MITDQAGAVEPQNSSCSFLSQASGEALYGSASTALVWFLLEYNHPTGAKAFEESVLTASFKTAFSSYVEAVQGARLQLIKQRTDLTEEFVTLFICLSREKEPALYEFKAQSYDDLLSLNFPAILGEDPGYAANHRLEPLFLVCTNGKRDPCCARWGLPLYNSLSMLYPGEIWQTSHVGGHRFAPNLVCFPHGLYYGRVEGEAGPALLEKYRQGRLSLEHYRGRSAYPAAAQAGEYFLRKQTGLLGLEDFLLQSVEQVEQQVWNIVFQNGENTGQYRLQVSARPSGTLAPESCGSQELKPVMLYHLDQYESSTLDESSLKISHQAD